jgi:hypothetical protein
MGVKGNINSKLMYCRLFMPIDQYRGNIIGYRIINRVLFLATSLPIDVVRKNAASFTPFNGFVNLLASDGIG